MPISEQDLSDGLLQILEERGHDMVQAFLNNHVILRNDSDGTGAYIDIWDSSAVGPLPDDLTIAAKAIQRRAKLAAQTAEETRLDQVVEDAKTSASALPGWASWTEAEALTWMDANIESQLQTNFPNTYALLTNLVKLNIAMRNKLWPDLEGS